MAFLHKGPSQCHPIVKCAFVRRKLHVRMSKLSPVMSYFEYKAHRISLYSVVVIPHL